MSSAESSRGNGSKEASSSGGCFDPAELRNRADQAIQNHYAPDAVVIDLHWQIRQFRGSTGFYLRPARGEARYRLLPMTREDLRPALRKAITAAIEKNVAVEEQNIRLEDPGEVREINVRVLPLADDSSPAGCFLVIFERTHPGPVLPASVPGSSDSLDVVEERLKGSQRELAETREYLRSIEHEYETALEELRAANEEIGSANEELRCKNDELETAKEDLQSANEELATIAGEMNRQNHDLKLLSNDLGNLLDAIQVPILIVDLNLRVRRFTATAEQRFHVSERNIGQSLSDLGAPLSRSSLDQLTREVINDLTTQTRELQDEDNSWWSLTVRPYRTREGRIDGALLIFTDIDVFHRHLEAVQAARDYADTIIDTVDASLILLSPALQVRRANCAFYHLFRLSCEQTVGKSFLDLKEGLWNLTAVRDSLEAAWSNRTELDDLEIEVNASSLGQKILRLSARAIVEGVDDPAILLAIRDVSEQEHAKRALLRSNEDLHNFAAVVAHDLQEPLRTIGTYTQLLVRRYRSHLDADAQQFADFVSEGVSRMQSMIQDLLEYAQVTLTNIGDLQPASSTAALSEALANLGSALDQNSGEVTHSELPTVLYNRRQLVQLFQNLLGNALKYRRPEVPPRIQVIAARLRGEWIFSVRDNGVGFAPEYAKQIFGVFKRLHGRNYAGTGIGLSICQRIVEHHGGRIWAESEPGVGSVFSFTIPIPDEQSPKGTEDSAARVGPRS